MRLTTRIHSAFALIATLLSCFCCTCHAIAIGKGLIRIDDQNFSIRETGVPLNLTDTRLSIAFTILRDGDSSEFVNPKQVMVSLSSPNIGSEFYLHPHLIEGKIYESNILVSDISSFLLSAEEIKVTVITGDPDTSYNDIISLGSIRPSAKLRQNKHVEYPDRFQAKPEIHHIFREPPKSLPTFVTLQFSLLLFTLLAVLFFSWRYFNAVNFENLGKLSPFTFAFLATIALFEYYFYDYYLGASIFTTLYRVAITGIVALFFGSKALNNLYSLRMEDNRKTV